MDVEIKWADSGRADCARYGIDLAEPVAVVYAESSIQIHVGEGPDRIIFLGGRVGAVMVVTVDREARMINGYRIAEVRPATAGESAAWEKRQR